MKNKTSSPNHLLQVMVSNENRKPPLIFHLPEHEASKKVAKSEASGHDHISGFSTHAFYGSGRCMRYSHYNIIEPKDFFTIPLEPVVAIRIQVENESYSKYVGKPDSKGLWPQDHCRLFWQGEEVVKNHLLPGKHTHLDVFFRPSVIEELADRHPKIKELTQQISSAKLGNLDFHAYQASPEMAKFVNENSDELFTDHLTVERLNYLSDCVLLLSVGIELEIEPAPPAPPEEENKEVEKGEEMLLPKRYEPSEEESAFLKELNKLDTERLLADFKIERGTYEEIENHYAESKRLIKTLKDRDEAKTVKMVHSVAEGYMLLARRLAELSKTPKLGKKKAAKLKRAIIQACDNAFALRMAMPHEMKFYSDWTKQPYFSKGIPMDSASFGNMMSMLMPDMKMDTSEMDPTHDVGALFMERLQETFGFKPSSHFTGETEADKPIEIVQLYKLLINKLSDNLKITDDGKIERNDIIRLLDNAYERNNYIALLNLEIKYLTSDPDYLAAQSPDKLRWYLTALLESNEKIEESMERLSDDPDCHYLKFTSPNGSWTDENDAKFEEWVADKFQTLNQFLLLVVTCYKLILNKPSIDDIMKTVDILLKLGDEVIKLIEIPRR